MFKPTKLGRVIFVSTEKGNLKGALIEDISDRQSLRAEKRADSPPVKLLVPEELLIDLKLVLKEGQIVEFEEENDTVIKIHTLSEKAY